MKLSKQMLFEKLDKVSAAGATHMQVKAAKKAVCLTYRMRGADCFDLLMTTRTIRGRDRAKEARRTAMVNECAEVFTRWFNEWRSTRG